MKQQPLGHKAKQGPLSWNDADFTLDRGGDVNLQSNQSGRTIFHLVLAAEVTDHDLVSWARFLAGSHHLIAKFLTLSATHAVLKTPVTHLNTEVKQIGPE